MHGLLLLSSHRAGQILEENELYLEILGEEKLYLSILREGKLYLPIDHVLSTPNRRIGDVLKGAFPPRYITWHMDLIGKDLGSGDLGESSELFASAGPLLEQCISLRTDSTAAILCTHIFTDSFPGITILAIKISFLAQGAEKEEGKV